MRALFTIGYEGASVEDLVATLRMLQVDTLLDIRAVAISRKPGFSKRRLAEHVQRAGLKYEHVPALGNPKPGRDAAKNGEFSKYQRIFAEHLLRHEVQLALSDVAHLSATRVVCLLCFERSHSSCHRTPVAAALSKMGSFRVQHAEVPLGAATLHEVSHAQFLRQFAVG